MTERIDKIKDFIILAEDYLPEENMIKTVKLEKEMIGFVFYVSGMVSVDVLVNKKEKSYIKNTGYSSSFYYSPDETLITHKISNKTPLKKVSLFITPSKLLELVNNDEQITSNFKSILKPNAPFVEGSNFILNPEMQVATQKIINCQYTGVIKDLLLESQATELLSHYLNQINNVDSKINKLQNKDFEKLHHAKSLLIEKIDSPPSLTELSKLSGLNSFKLKQGFKALFGMPVYKYLQNERMKKSFELLEMGELNVQEIAHFVGYESLSSFSNLFYNKYNVRPSEVRK